MILSPTKFYGRLLNTNNIVLKLLSLLYRLNHRFMNCLLIIIIRPIIVVSYLRLTSSYVF